MEAVGEKHDRGRATPGLFNKIVAGLEQYRRHGGGVVVIWMNLTRENMAEVQDVARFAQNHRAFVECFPAASYAGYNEKIVLTSADRNAVFSRVLELKKQGLPIHNTDYSLELMRSGRAFRCNIPRLSIQLAADGQIWPCEARVIPDLKPHGHLDSLTPADLIASPAFRKVAAELSSCNRCLLPCVGHLADNIILQALRQTFERLR
jgi:MoaA/NifB/PqqE/SkfB family radical SAM enzyme